ncbi:hypothetical protein COW98_03160 [Candidatus Roizmanbacteria bacterium CG22_combo_CG10-13_8_21_14_all_35_9]|uniref:PrgI family protein n=4 Tax=Candidatus Roizmaniibacteriota TaxID=1752723 RepID=A0A2M8F154_9BACT|nr:MAG: hypothetical protein COX47_00255 [Candidatus Roizmanbacteria bacterium CG23_combo_of_CG06-09_8_20_14_all_35_49]PIP62604.1 MAG: hypothetical protein COW98_03160 [Candidatus Roizmanbacteria bacterium CG22_combo_CG10-13_8_21_14_all_35_9]PIY70773.1 MAG: hypothetical protein COY88_03880 [Candidatus Roizmanbacteria bacterium CG_4_10_14_0_8_um_filter_35_28]PJC33007.1 MAG: hypothetical protein CO048_04015 [Candidatus Roizmanbacteria bacterium CG_4_9_14_0_2_um_filter_35_15]PJC82788.1 MAG: hypoth
MDQHSIPRQITTFEFKLIGFLTVKQFIYLLIFIVSGIIVYYIFPIPYLNILAGLMVGLIGVALAFVPVNDRPLEVWIRNLFKRLISPTQYFYKKNNKPLYFLQDMTFSSNPSQITTHLDSQKKLSNYLSTKNSQSTNNKKQNINNLIQDTFAIFVGKKPKQNQPVANFQQPVSNFSYGPKHPFLTGSVKNKKNTPLTDILIYIKQEENSPPLRILKTNSHGIFATFNPLTLGDYLFQIKDPSNHYFFDTMKIKIEENNNQPIEIISKELI